MVYHCVHTGGGLQAPLLKHSCTHTHKGARVCIDYSIIQLVYHLAGYAGVAVYSKLPSSEMSKTGYEDVWYNIEEQYSLHRRQEHTIWPGISAVQSTPGFRAWRKLEVTTGKVPSAGTILAATSSQVGSSCSFEGAGVKATQRQIDGKA